MNVKRLWGKIVFRYAGRNLFSHDSIKSRKFYNVIGYFYDWIYTRHIAGYQQSLAMVAREYINPEDDVLDIGCGTGNFLQLISDKASFMVGVDISAGMLHQMDRKKWKHKPLLAAADCHALPLKHSFDKIFTSFMLVIFTKEERGQIVRQWMEFLKPGGEMIFMTAQDDISSQWLTAEEWTEICRSAGLESVEIHDIYDYFRIVRAIKSK